MSRQRGHNKGCFLLSQNVWHYKYTFSCHYWTQSRSCKLMYSSWPVPQACFFWFTIFFRINLNVFWFIILTLVHHWSHWVSLRKINIMQRLRIEILRVRVLELKFKVCHLQIMWLWEKWLNLSVCQSHLKVESVTLVGL